MMSSARVSGLTKAMRSTVAPFHWVGTHSMAPVSAAFPGPSSRVSPTYPLQPAACAGLAWTVRVLVAASASAARVVAKGRVVGRGQVVLIPTP